jgi:hypothetical protein
VTDRIDFGGEPWQAIPRRILRDPQLSPAAKGGLVTLLSHEEGWVRSAIATLRRECACGEKQARTIMRELVKAGYAELRQVRGKGGQFATAYVVRAQGGDPRPRTGVSPGSRDGHPVQSHAEVEPNGDPHKNLSDEPVAGVENIGKTRPRDPAFDELAELHGGATGLSRQMAKTVGVALAGIKRATPNVGAEEIQRRVAGYRRLPWNRDRMLPSAQSLAKWWADCDRPEESSRPAPSPGLDDSWLDRAGES